MKPEDRARLNIDKLLEESVWQVQNAVESNSLETPHIIRETFSTTYLLVEVNQSPQTPVYSCYVEASASPAERGLNCRAR